MGVNDYLNQALKENGLQNGAINFDPPTAGRVFDRYKELMAMDEKQIRNHLINRFGNLNVGDMDELWTMPLDELESMVETLEQAQAKGRLDLETSEGMAELQRIVDGYLSQEGE